MGPNVLPISFRRAWFVRLTVMESSQWRAVMVVVCEKRDIILKAENLF